MGVIFCFGVGSCGWFRWCQRCFRCRVWLVAGVAFCFAVVTVDVTADIFLRGPTSVFRYYDGWHSLCTIRVRPPLLRGNIRQKLEPNMVCKHIGEYMAFGSHVCVFFTINRSFYSSASSTASVLPNPSCYRDTSSVVTKATIQAATLYQVDNSGAMHCHCAGLWQTPRCIRQLYPDTLKERKRKTRKRENETKQKINEKWSKPRK